MPRRLDSHGPPDSSHPHQIYIVTTRQSGRPRALLRCRRVAERRGPDWPGCQIEERSLVRSRNALCLDNLESVGRIRRGFCPSRHPS
jgi:hypothetical protein